MTELVWVHMEALSRDHPVFAAAPEGARAVYVWDEQDLARRNWSLKRCVFMLECLAEMKLEVFQGQPIEIFDALDAKRIYTAATPDPALRAIISDLGKRVEVVVTKPFASIPDETDMGRFFRYWNKAKRSALRQDQEA